MPDGGITAEMGHDQPYHQTVPDKGIAAGMGQDQPYHRTVPDGGITAGMGQDQSDLPRIRTWVRQALRLRTLPSWYFWL